MLIALKPGKLAHQFKYADRKAFEAVITVGEDEMAEKTFSRKYLETGIEEKSIPLQSLLEG